MTTRTDLPKTLKTLGKGSERNCTAEVNLPSYFHDCTISLRQHSTSDKNCFTDGGAELKGHASWFTLQFKDPMVESAFHSAKEAFSPLSLLGGPLVMVSASPVWRLQPWGPFTWGGAGVVTLFGVVLAGATCLGSAVRPRWFRRTLALLMIFSLSVFLLLDMVSNIHVCSWISKLWASPFLQGNCAIVEETELATNASLGWATKCPYPSYYSYIGVLALVVISMPAYISYLGKALLMSILAGAQCAVNVMILGPSLDREDIAICPPDAVAFPLKYSLSATLVLITLTLVVVAKYVSINWTFIDRIEDFVFLPSRFGIIYVQKKGNGEKARKVESGRNLISAQVARAEIVSHHEVGENSSTNHTTGLYP